MKNIFLAIVIHGIPLIEYYFLVLRKKLRKKELPILNCRVFILFATYGGLLVAITTLWQWSGLASLEVYTLFLLHLL
jgi:fatty acid desaturase